MHQIRFWLQFCPIPRLGRVQLFTRSPSWILRVTSYWRKKGGKGNKGKGWKKRKGRTKEGKEQKTSPQFTFLATPLCIWCIVYRWRPWSRAASWTLVFATTTTHNVSLSASSRHAISKLPHSTIIRQVSALLGFTYKHCCSGWVSEYAEQAYTTSDRAVTYLNRAQMAYTTPTFGLWRTTAAECCENKTSAN